LILYVAICRVVRVLLLRVRCDLIGDISDGFVAYQARGFIVSMDVLIDTDGGIVIPCFSSSIPLVYP
jgi:hypothetical protein